MKKKKKRKVVHFLKTNNWAQCAWVVCADCYVLKLWSANTHWTILTVESSRRISVEYIKFKLCYFFKQRRCCVWLRWLTVFVEKRTLRTAPNATFFREKKLILLLKNMESGTGHSFIITNINKVTKSTYINALDISLILKMHRYHIFVALSFV